MLNKRLAICTGLLVVLAGCSYVILGQEAGRPGESHEGAAKTQPESDGLYRIGPGDVLDIRIYTRPQLSRDAVRVEGSGMIRMPLLDTEIKAACLTEGELAKEISTRYAR